MPAQSIAPGKQAVRLAGDVINNGLDHQPDPEYYVLRKHHCRRHF